MPEEPDSTAQSIAEGILADLGDEPLIPEKPKRGRPKKEPTAAEVLAGDDDAALEAIEEPEDGDVEESETPEAKEGDDETEEPTELDDQLAALAQNYGVDPGLLEGAESVAEAERFISKMYSVLYREGAAQNSAQNGHAEHQQPMPAQRQAETQKTTDDALELDLSKYDDDEPIKSDLQKLLERDKRREAELAELRAEKDRARAEEFNRVQRDVAYQFQNEFFSIAPDLFGTDKKQDPRQAQRMRKAFDVADTLIRGHAASGRPLPSVKAIAKWAVQAEFAEELTKKQLLSKRGSVQERQNRRSVGAPARVGRSALNPTTSAQVYEGDLKDDPDLLAAVKVSLSKSRA